MTVWVVHGWVIHEGNKFLGVFSTREKAWDATEMMEDFDHFTVEEVAIDMGV
jgi:hypothetical protein